MRGGIAWGRRVAKPHPPPRARYIGCHQCHDLTYMSCQESHKYDGMIRLMAGNTGMDFDTVKRLMNRIGKRSARTRPARGGRDE